MARAGMVQILQAAAEQIHASVDSLAPDNWLIQVEVGMVYNPTPPTIDIYPGAVLRDAESAAFDDINGAYLFTVRARVAPNDNEAGQSLLLRFMDDMDPMSIAAALADEPSLNGYASSIDIRDVTGYLPYPRPSGDDDLGFQFTLAVIPAES